MNHPPELLNLLEMARQALAPLQAERAARLGVVADPLPPEVEGELPNLRALAEESQQRLLEGSPEEATAALHAMIDALRRIVPFVPTALPVLAGALSQLASRHTAALQLDAALWASVESAELHLAWVRQAPEPQFALLTQALDGLATQVELQGRVVEGLQLRIAVWQLQTRLAEDDPEMLPSLGLTVRHLAQQLGDLGQDELAVQLAQEGVDIQRRLENGFALTQALTLLSERLAAIEDHEEALATIDEAMALAGEPGNEVEVMVRARMLRQRATCQRALEAWDEAGAAIDESIRIYRRLALAHPAHRSNLVEALTVAAMLHRDADAHEEAVVLLAEAIGYLREEPLQGFFLVDRLTLLADSLANLARFDEALAADAEAVALARSLREQRPDRWGDLLTTCLEGQARHASEAERHEEAAVAWHEVAALRAASDGDEIDRALAVAEAQGHELEAWLAANRLDRVGEALAAIIHTQRTMSPNRPRVQGQLARNLVELAGFREDMGDVSGALAALGEAAVLCGGLLASHPEVGGLLALVEEARARLTDGGTFGPDVDA
jgi:tetratricopeptide (TPR) repeat protein